MSTEKCGHDENIGSRLKLYRTSKKMTLVELAKILEISHSSLSNIENSHTKPSADTITNLVRHTDIDIEWLLTGKKKESSRRGESTTQLNETGSQRDVRIDLVDEIKEWLSEIVGKNPSRKGWFEIEFEESFPSFKRWKARKDSKQQA